MPAFLGNTLISDLFYSIPPMLSLPNGQCSSSVVGTRIDENLPEEPLLQQPTEPHIIDFSTNRGGQKAELFTTPSLFIEFLGIRRIVFRDCFTCHLTKNYVIHSNFIY